MQDEIGFGGSGVGQILLIILLTWSLINLYKVYRLPGVLPKSLNMTLIFLMSFIAYGIYSMLFVGNLYVQHSGREVPSITYAKDALMSLLPIFSFYYFPSKNLISVKQLQYLTIVFLFLIIVSYYHNEAKLLNIALTKGRDITEITNNASYQFVYIIPYLYLFKKKKLSLAILSVILLFLVIGMKRGAILVGIGATMLYLHDIVKDGSINQRIGRYAMIIVLVLCTSYFVLNFYNQSAYFRYRVEQTKEGKSSGRDEIANDLWSFYTTQDKPLNTLFGYGANATLIHADNFAHNDWLEILIDQGLLGISLQLCFFIVLFKDVTKLKRYNTKFYQSFRTLYFIILIKTFFSMSICEMIPYQTLLVGYYLFNLKYYKKYEYYLKYQ